MTARARIVRRSPFRASALLLAFVFLSCWRWEIIGSSVVSLILSPLVVAGVQGEAARYLRPDLVEFWVAGAAWCALLYALLRMTLRAWRKEGSPPANSRPLAWARVALLLLALAALLAPFLAPFDPLSQGDLRTMRLLGPMASGIETAESVPPGDDVPAAPAAGSVERLLGRADKSLLVPHGRLSRWEGPSRGEVKPFLMGTDDLGRDIFSRLLYGIRVSLLIGLAAMICAVTAGSVVGLTAGIAGGWIDAVLMRTTDLFLSVPSMFLVIALISFFGNSLLLLILVLAAIGWMGVARIVRGEVRILRDREFVLAARLLGRTSFQIVRDHMVPNVLPLIVAASVLQLANVVLAEAALSFLGLGIQPPTPSLGNMIGESFAHIGNGWWAGLFPGAALSLIVVSANYVADSLRRAAEGLS